MKINDILLAAFLVLSVVSCVNTADTGKTPDYSESWKTMEKPLNFYIANDLGRNGYYDQKTVAETMGRMAETIDVEFVVAAGDVHHFEGVRSVSDPLWMTNYELIYTHPDLMMPWYAICGNHEYRGNTQAVIDYSDISGRWNMPSRYYTFVKEEDGTEVRIVMIDTTPLIDKYREDTEKYADASKSDYREQLSWLDSTLAAADEEWVIVFGHHPVYAYTDKSESERSDMQQRVDTILRKYGNVDMYVCGHIHTFQHIRMNDCDIDYVVNASGSLGRDVEPIEGTVYCSGETGWSLVTADDKALNLYMLDKYGKVLHTVTRTAE